MFAVAVAIHRALNHVLQFANIPRPAVAEQRRGRSFAKAGKQRQTEFAAHLDGKLVGEQHDVALPVAQRGELYHVEGQAVEQVGTKMTFLDHLRQVSVGGAHQPDVNLQRLAAAHALQLAIFNHS